ncbi:MAG: exodeoxyribonuclease VII large subunit [Burkholderiales bacterium]|nr:exodeoxyribonuclease VII large subunit [Burkholderiales bacterium]
MTFVSATSDTASTHVWTVGTLCHAISDQLKSRFGLVHVRGEISGLTRAGSGHCYLTLKDEQGQLRCAMFRRVAEGLTFDPRNGDLVEIQARCGLYEPRGELQLVIEAMRPAGAGQLHEAFLRLKAQLQAEGLFDAERKREIPPRPSVIGVVTSLSAAALHDVLTALRRRVPHIPVVISPSPVQGVEAPSSLVSALSALQAMPKVEVILLVRGGGSMEDLWAFNDETLARAIVSSRVPVVVGVGHETDFTIADFCADLRAPTPTAAAELCALDLASELAALDHWQALMAQSMSAAVEQAWQRLDRAERQIGRPSGWMHTQQHSCSVLANRMSRVVHNYVNRRQLALQPMVLRLQRAAVDMPALLARRLEKAQWLLQTLDPALVLKRGYAWLENSEGTALSSVKDLHAGQTVTARLVDGEAQLRVEKLP